MPPGFCASAGVDKSAAASSPAAAAEIRKFALIAVSNPLRVEALRLPVEPDVFHAPAVESAVGHRRQTFELGLHAGGEPRIEQYRAGSVLRQLALDLPDQLATLRRIRFPRLPVDQSVGLFLAIACVIAVGPADIGFVEFLVGLVEAALGHRDADRVVLADDPWKPVCGIDGLELAVDVDLAQLRDRNDRRVAIAG